MIFESQVARPRVAELQPETGRSVQRKCACGGAAGPTGECEQCSRKRLALQRKLMVNQPGDHYEQEADRAAATVTNDSVPTSGVGLRDSSGFPAAEEAPPIVHEVLASSSQPLGRSTATDMSRRFGYDFSRVRVHTDARAAESARAVNAHAYTVGGHIAFGSGRYAPGSSEGQKLLAHELVHVVQQSGGATATVQRQPASPAKAPEKPEEKRAAAEGEAKAGKEEGEGELSPIRKKLVELFGKFEKSVIGDEVFDKVETQKAWDQQKAEEAEATKAYNVEKEKYDTALKAWEAGGRKGEKPKPPIPVPKFTTCIATQQVILTQAFKETGLAIKKQGKLPKYALATQGAQTAEAIAPADAAGPGAWHWGRMGMGENERPKRGDIIVMAFRGGTVDQGAKELNYILNIKYGTAQKVKANEEAKAKLKASGEAIARAQESLEELQQNPKAANWQLRAAQARLERAINALNATKKAADKAASDVENLKKPTPEERAPAEAKLEAARKESAAARAERLKEPVGSKKRYMFQFSHVGFLQNRETLTDGREKWTTFDGGQLVEREGKKVEGAQTSIRYYDPKSNEISGELQQGGEARWLYGWVDVDKLVAKGTDK
jgi:hypothetical protein